MSDTDRIRARLLLWRHFPRVLRLASRQPKRTAAGAVAWVLAGLLGLGFPYAIKLFVDGVLSAGNTDLLPVVAALVAGLILCRAACEAASAVLLAGARAETAAALRLDLHARILRAPLSEIESRKSAALHDRVLQDIESVVGLLYGSGPLFLRALALFLGAAAVSLWMHWRLALAGMAAVPPFLVLSFIWVRRLRPRYKDLSERRSQLGATLQQHYAGARVLKGFAREGWAVERAAAQQADLVEKTIRLTRLQAALSALSALVTGAGLVALLWMGGLVVHAGGISPGKLMALYATLAYLAASAQSLVGLANTIQQSLASAERVFELADLPSEESAGRASPADLEIKIPPADLEIRNLVFAYPDSPAPQSPIRNPQSAIPNPQSAIRNPQFAIPNPQSAIHNPPSPVLNGLSLHLPVGGIVALVGPSGVGKTTTAALVARLLKPDAGEILWDGADVATLPLEVWRRALAIVHQEDWLLAASVRENLVLGRKNIAEHDVWHALSLACARRLVESLPNGLDTEVEERGHRLSGGERQRICLARAFLSRPRLLLLDEATAALDLNTEAEIFDNLDRLPETPSVLLISHRLSAVSAADRVYFLEDGRIVEEGSHEELVARGGRYAEAFRLQNAPKKGPEERPTE